jgi:hypothetical protein
MPARLSTWRLLRGATSTAPAPRRIRLAAPSRLTSWLRRAYLRLLIRCAEEDLLQLEAEAAALPRRAAAYRRHISALRAELALNQ